VNKLTGTDAKALIECAGEIYSIHDAEAFPLVVLKAVEKLVPSHMTAYCKISRSDTGVVKSDVISEASLSGVKGFNRHIHEHPFINLMHMGKVKPHPFIYDILESVSKRLPEFGSRPGATAVKISDALTDKQYRSLDIYNDGMRDDGINYQMGIVLGSVESNHNVACFHRDTKDFSERDRLVLNLLGPHMVQAARNIEINAWRRRAAAKGEDDCGAVILSRDRKVKFMTDAAAIALSRHYTRVVSGGRLPADLDAWVRQERRVGVAAVAAAPKAFRKAGAATDLVVRRISGLVGEETLIVTERQRPEAMVDKLVSMGLTAREAEVLYWVAHGKSNTAVSGILSITLNTVKKHLDRVYQKLGVENRTAAAKAALELLCRA